MRSTTIATLILVTSLSVLAGTSAAQDPAQNPPPQPPPAQSAPDQRGPVTIGAGMMTPEMM